MKPFLTARWMNLAMLNYEIDPGLLAKYVPQGTELDFFNGKTYASMIAFSFLDTRVKGIPIPFHKDFEEINLRFYVRRKYGEEWRRGVVFIKEIVPKVAISLVAKICYNENYVSMPTRSDIAITDKGASVNIGWKFKNRWNTLAVNGDGKPQSIAIGSMEEFITEHYYGYSAQRDGGTVEYGVEHPRWRYWQGKNWKFDCDVAGLYGKEFVGCLAAKPTSVFIAEGSAVTVRDGVKL